MYEATKRKAQIISKAQLRFDMPEKPRQTRDDDSRLPAAVTDAIERGCSVIPVRRDKTPYFEWKPYQTKRATLEEAERWQEEFDPDGWAVVTGKISRRVVLDFDGNKGRNTLQQLGLKPHVQTGSDGFHCHLEHPGSRVPTLNGKTKRDLGKAYPGLDIRADGGYAIFCGRNSSGNYKILRPLVADDLDSIPRKLRRFLGLAKAKSQGLGPSDEAANSLLEEAADKIRGEGRNNTGFWLACQLRDRRLPFEAAARVMLRYVLSAPEVNQKGEPEPYTEAEALASLEQAYSREPRRTSDQLYFQNDNGIFWRKPSKDGEAIVQLANFRAQIVEDVVTDDGVETNRKFLIAANVNGRSRKVPVAAKDFANMNWIYDGLGPSAVICAGVSARDHCRAAIQLLSADIRRSRIYTYTGWRKIGGKYYYLHAGGAIGAEGSVELQVGLPLDLAPFNLPDPPTGAALTRAVKASLSILKLGPRQVVVPLYCAVWRSVLGSCNYSLHSAGRTGTFKTSVSLLLQQHFGKGFSSDNLPATWSSTDNFLEGLQFTMKDAPLLIDDFAPKGNKSDIERSHQKADRILRGQGNRAGRGRMKPDSTLRATKKARGTTLSTGEDTPRGESLKARLMILEFDKNTIDPDRLAICQDKAAAGLYAEAMAAFLCWLASQYETITANLPKRIAALRQKAEKSNQHRRTPEIVANLMLGLKLFLRFCSEKNILSDEEVAELRSNAWEALGQAAAAQAREQRADEPARRFVDLISAALAGGDVHLRDANTGIAMKRSSGRCVGWIDPEYPDYVLLEPDISFAEAQRMANLQGEALPVAKHTLWKRLREKNFIALSEKDRNLVKWPINGISRRVVCLWAKTLFPKTIPISANEQ
jgi:hypothetical protein